MINYYEIIQGVEKGLLQMKDPKVDFEDFMTRFEKYKCYTYKGLSDDEIFWILTYVMFFNMGKKASMIEKKLPLLKQIWPIDISIQEILEIAKKKKEWTFAKGVGHEVAAVVYHKAKELGLEIMISSM